MRLTCAIVVGIKQGKQRADHEDVGVLGQHLDDLGLAVNESYSGFLHGHRHGGERGFYMSFLNKCPMRALHSLWI